MRIRSQSMFVSEKELQNAKEESELTSEEDCTKLDFNLLKSENEENTWTARDEMILLNRIKKQVPKNDNISYDSRIDQLNWNEVKFNNYDEDEVQSRFKVLLENFRTFRLLDEILNDMQSEVFSRLSVPKKPIPPFALFVLENKDKLKDCCKQEARDYMKKASELFKELTEEERQKYKNRSWQMRSEYQNFLGKLSLDYTDGKKSKKEKLLTKIPVTVFYEHMCKKDGTLSLAHAKREFVGLDKYEKLKWILLWAGVPEGEKLNKTQYEKAKECLSKEEIAILDEYEGKPRKLPSAYNVFIKEFIAKAKNMSKKEAYTKALDEWKMLSAEEKCKYFNKVMKIKIDTKKRLEEYWASLPLDRRLNKEKEKNRQRKKQIDAPIASSKKENAKKRKNSVAAEDDSSNENEINGHSFDDNHSYVSDEKELEVGKNIDKQAEKDRKCNIDSRQDHNKAKSKTKKQKKSDESSNVTIFEEPSSQGKLDPTKSKSKKKKKKIRIDSKDSTDAAMSEKSTPKKKFNQCIESSISNKPNECKAESVLNEKIGNSKKKKKIGRKNESNDDEEKMKKSQNNQCVTTNASFVDVSKKIEKLRSQKPPSTPYKYFVLKLHKGSRNKAKSKYRLLSSTQKDAIDEKHSRAKEQFLETFQKFAKSLSVKEFKENEGTIRSILIDQDEDISDITEDEND